jgi:hypothetical protein
MDHYSLEIARTCYCLCHAPFLTARRRNVTAFTLLIILMNIEIQLKGCGQCVSLSTSVGIAGMTCDLISNDMHHAITPAIATELVGNPVPGPQINYIDRNSTQKRMLSPDKPCA